LFGRFENNKTKRMKLQILGPLTINVTILNVLVLFSIVGTCFADIPTVRLARSEAVDMAIKRNIDLRLRALDSSLAKNEITASESIYNPYLTAALEYSQTNVAGEKYGTETTSGSLSVSKKLPTGATVSLTGRTSPISSYSDPLYDYTDWSSSIGVSLYQPLLKNAGKDATELGIEQDKFAYQASIENFREDVIDTVFSVISEYNGLYVLYQLLESRKTAFETAQQLLEEIQAKPATSAGHEIDISNTEYALSQRQTELIEAERQVSSREAKLRYLIGMDDKVHIIPTDAPSRMEPGETEEQAIALALDNRPDLHALRIQLQSSKLREKVSRRNLLPNLGLTASGGYRGYEEDGTFGGTVDQVLDGKGEYWSAGMVLSYSLGNDLAESEYLRNKLRSEQLQNRIIATEWKIKDMIRDDNRSLISARQQLRTTAKSKRFAEQRVAEYKKNFRLGLASVKDLIDAENDLIYARNLELKATETFAFRVARLWKDIGILLERQKISMDLSEPETVTSTRNPPAQAIRQNLESQTDPHGNKVVADNAILSNDLGNKDLDRTAQTVKVNQSDFSQSAEGQTGMTDKKRPKQTEGFDLSKNTSFTIRIGDFSSAEVEQVKQKLQRVGLVPVVMDGGKKSRHAYRLVLGQYPDLKTARQALQTLTDPQNGFVLKAKNGAYDVFAGSFFDRQRAVKQQKSLAAQGIVLNLRPVNIELPAFTIITGSFSSREAAKEMGKKLEQQGLDFQILESV
jgi:outer membrane protein TolC